MMKPLAALIGALLCCTAFAQGIGLKPSTGLGKAPSTSSGQPPATKSEQAPGASSVEVPAPGPQESNPGVETLEKIFTCLSVGLPKDWRSATVEVTELALTGKERQFEARYTYTRMLESKPLTLEPCETTGPAKSVHALNDFLEPEKRQWKRAILTFSNDGKFELKYDYAE